MTIYLDNAATSARKPASVISSITKNTVFNSTNAGRGTYKNSLKAVNGMLNTADSLAELFNISDSSKIAFTQNATYALNLLILGWVKPQEHVIITQMEHNSVLRPVHRLGNYTIAEADKSGFVSPESIEKAIRHNTCLIICNHASNVCGSIQDIEKIGRLAKRYKIPLMVDAAQTAGVVDIDVEKMNISMLAFSGHKGLMGPLGTGGLYTNAELVPIITGGTGSMSESFTQPDIMPDKLQCGTQNTPAIIALGEGVNFVKAHHSEILEKERALASELFSDISSISGVSVYGIQNGSRNGTVAFNIDDFDCIRVAEILEKDYGILVRSGFHCAPLAHQALGTGSIGCVRASFGFFNNLGQEKKLADAINRIRKIF